MEGCCSLACSPGLSQPAFLYNPGPPAEGWYHPQWDGPSHPHQSSIKKMHYRLDYSQSHGGIFSTEASSTQMAPACVTLRKTNQHEVLLPWLFLLLSAHHCPVFPPALLFPPHLIITYISPEFPRENVIGSVHYRAQPTRGLPFGQVASIKSINCI